MSARADRQPGCTPLEPGGLAGPVGARAAGVLAAGAPAAGVLGGAGVVEAGTANPSAGPAARAVGTGGDAGVVRKRRQLRGSLT